MEQEHPCLYHTITHDRANSVERTEKEIDHA